jgi:hypothetical protein
VAFPITRQAAELPDVHGVLVWLSFVSLYRPFALIGIGRIRFDVCSCKRSKDFRMNQEQYTRLLPVRKHLDAYYHVGSVNMPHDHAQILQDVHKELFGNNFNAWCQSCLIDAMKAVFVQFDNYAKAGAPIILNPDKTAEVKVKRGKKL